MLKYCCKVFDENNDLFMQTICPAEDLFDVLAALKEFGVVKAFILESEDNVSL